MLKRFLLTGAALTALTGFAVAQTAPADPAPPPVAEVPAPGMTNPAAPGMAVDPAVKADPNLYSNITGANVVGQDDESVGRLADVLIDTSGQLKALVIAHGGIVGIGQTYRHYDVSELPSVSDGKITIGGLNTAALDGLPEYAYPDAATGRAATTETPEGGPSVATAPAESSAAAPSDALWPASYLVGARVGSEEDKAAISDLRFAGNRVTAALIDKGSLGLGNKVQEVAFADLQISGSPSEPQITLASGGGAMSNPNAESSTVPGGAPAPAPAP